MCGRGYCAPGFVEAAECGEELGQIPFFVSVGTMLEMLAHGTSEATVEGEPAPLPATHLPLKPVGAADPEHTSPEASVHMPAQPVAGL